MKSERTAIDVSTDLTDTPALLEEQKDTPSVTECNSFLQILEEGVCKTIHKDFRENGQVCTSKAASDILCAALRAEDGLGETYQKLINDEVKSSEEHMLISGPSSPFHYGKLETIFQREKRHQ